MQITKISSPNQNRIFKAKYVIPRQAATIEKGGLTYNTRANLNSITQAYREIREKLNYKTEEGLQYIQQKFPNISIGEGLIFHNCGDKKSSIVIKCAESIENKGLMKIIERKSGTSWGEGIVLNSFLVEDNHHLIKNSEDNKLKSFPKEREYFTEQEIKTENKEKILSEVLENLDYAMLLFRKFLLSIEDKYTRTPDGVLPYQITSKFNTIQSLQRLIDSELSKLPKKVELEVRKIYPNYKLVTGLTTHAFKDVGPEQVSITYNPIIAPGFENLRRLNIFDKDGKLVQTFAVTTNGKMVSNLYQGSTTHLPDKLSFFDEIELQKDENSTVFQKHLTYYHDHMKNLLEHVKKLSLDRFRYMNSRAFEIPKNLQENLSFILENIYNLEEDFENIKELGGTNIKNRLPNLISLSSKTGAKLEGFLGDKTINLAIIKSSRHDDLIKISICDKNNKQKFFILKDMKYIVKNINPQYPNMMPKKLIFLTEADDDVTPEIQQALDYIKAKFLDYNALIKERYQAIEEAENTANTTNQTAKITEANELKELKRLAKENRTKELRERRLQEAKERLAKKAQIREAKLLEQIKIKQERVAKQAFKKFSTEVNILEQLFDLVEKHFETIENLSVKFEKSESIPQEELRETMNKAQKLGTSFDKLHEDYKALLEKFEIKK